MRDPAHAYLGAGEGGFRLYINMHIDQEEGSEGSVQCTHSTFLCPTKSQRRYTASK